MSDEHTPPQPNLESFHCPHCNVYARQYSGSLFWINTDEGDVMEGQFNSWKLDKSVTEYLSSYTIKYCENCEEFTMWRGQRLIYPSSVSAPEPVEDMPSDVESDFREARQIVDDSPKASAALLRLAMEKLTEELLESSEGGLYDNIGALVEEGLIGERIQKALDSVRVTGNDYVHAGEIYEPDDRDTALRLFDLVNIIVEVTITREKMIEEAYSEIPDNKKEGIENRDGGS
ncbi:DUF4145 domain-containing protein (plasmid) [Halobacterium sp. NMX12-1]|uniref:DUF4145 domain-containing protein n=1 Tax=Halobacterium sp. NMX12-1 TaxID=3166650 RepID=A0AAU8C8P6_9EURY